MEGGLQTRKLNRWGASQPRVVRVVDVEGGGCLLSWRKGAGGAGDDASSLDLKQVRSITNGISQQSSNFRRKGKGKKMALYASVVTRGRSLDLELATEQQRDWFVTGLRELCHALARERRARSASSAGSPPGSPVP